jgi:hypothetical protein
MLCWYPKSTLRYLLLIQPSQWCHSGRISRKPCRSCAMGPVASKWIHGCSLQTWARQKHENGDRRAVMKCADVKTRITIPTITIKYPHKCKIIKFKISTSRQMLGHNHKISHYRFHPHSCQLAVKEVSLKKPKEERFKWLYSFPNFL